MQTINFLMTILGILAIVASLSQIFIDGGMLLENVLLELAGLIGGTSAIIVAIVNKYQ